MLTIMQQLCDMLINGAAYILAVLVGTAKNNSIFTNFNFFTTVNSADNPFLNILMQGMVGATDGGSGPNYGQFIYRLAFILFGVLVAVQIFKLFINPASRGNATPVRSVSWIIFTAFLMIFGQSILSTVLSGFTTLIQDNMKSLFNLSELDSETNLIKWYDALGNLTHLNRYGAAMICAAGVGGSLLRASITYLERYLSFAVTCYMGPFAMAMATCDDTRRSTTQWLQSVVSQMIGIVLSLMFLYMGAQALTMSNAFIGDHTELEAVIIKSVGATAFFSLSFSSEKFLSAFGIQTMHMGDTAQAVANGARLAMGAAIAALRVDAGVAKAGAKAGFGTAANRGLLNNMKFSSSAVSAPGVSGALKRAHNANMDNITKKYGGVVSTGGITRGADGKLSFAMPNGATQQDKKILDGLNKGRIQDAIAQGGLQKKEDGSPVNAKAAKTLKDYGVNNANDLARAMYGDKAFKNGESYQMASMLRGDKTGGQYLVLSGVDQNGNLITKAPRVPDRATSTLSEQTQKALGESDKAYSNAEKQRNNTVARDPREKALMDAGYANGYRSLANDTLGTEGASKFKQIDSATLSEDGRLTFTGKGADGKAVQSSVDTMYNPNASTSRLSEAAQSALRTDAEPLSNEQRTELGTKAVDQRERALMNAGYENGYTGLAQSMLGEREASKYASIDSASLSDDGKLTFTGKDKDGADLTSTVNTAGSHTFASNGERLLNANNQAVAEINSRGNVTPYNVADDSFNIADIPIKSEFTPHFEQKTAFATRNDGQNVVPMLGADPHTLVDNPAKVSDYLPGFSYDPKHNQFVGYAAIDDTALNLDAPADERRKNIGRVVLNIDELRNIPSADKFDSLEGLPSGTLIYPDGHQETINVRAVDGQYSMTSKDHRGTTAPLYAITEEEFGAIKAEEHEAQNSKANSKKKDQKKGSKDSDDSDDA